MVALVRTSLPKCKSGKLRSKIRGNQQVLMLSLTCTNILFGLQNNVTAMKLDKLTTNP